MRDDRDFQDSLESHIRAANRPELDSLILADELLRSVWPSGAADRFEPEALSWLQLWGPVKLVVGAPECGCATGHCPICN